MGRAGKRLGIFAVVALIGLAACSSDDDSAMTSNVYFGAVAMATDRMAVAVDGDGVKVHAYVVDAEPGGDAEWFEGTIRNNAFNLTSASGNARIEGTVGRAETTGHVTLADGVRRPFHTSPATHGAGIYDVTVAPDGHITGTSTDGSTMDARPQGDYVQGKITTKRGEEVVYRNVDLSRAFNYPTLGGHPDRYTLIVGGHGLVQMGRGGENLKKGSPSANLIALDLAASPMPTPGVYYGRASMTDHRLAASVDPPDAEGARLVRVYFCDGRPDGDIEWFTGMVPESGAVDLTSASANAQLTGQLSDADLRGTVKLASGHSVPIFAVPAGEGAGIYDIEVTTDKRYVGTSDKGDELELRQDGHMITGRITTPAGQTVEVLAYDLTDVFEYPQPGSAPDRYVALVSPGGRHLTGRSGDVRDGSAATNVIGLDAAG